jgi:hypothetical protein
MGVEIKHVFGFYTSKIVLAKIYSNHETISNVPQPGKAGG